MKHVEAFSQEYYKIENETKVVDCIEQNIIPVETQIPEANIVGVIGLENLKTEDYELYIDNSDTSSEPDITIIRTDNVDSYSIGINPAFKHCISSCFIAGFIITVCLYLSSKADDDDNLRG